MGLSEVSTDDLLQLESALASGAIKAPVSSSSLGMSGFSHVAAALEPFLTLDLLALRAVLQVALAERRKADGQRLDLVWSGSDSGPSYARYTKVVIPELIGMANRQITIAGYSFDQGAGIFSILHEAMQRQVSVRLFLDVHQLCERLSQQLRQEKRFSRIEPVEKARKAGSTAFAGEVLGLFREMHWPYEGLSPELYYDPRTAEHRSFASLHAKCLIVDFEQVLVTSANFTARGQDRNIEVGVIVRDREYATALERQWNNLIDSGDVVAWG
ncbi:MAG TPA: DISARM system phospholipase D-like protein DrmC [Polyangiaceae bacterium]|nr:DISARM system phospholipase D-like protein DrmC [Polyangiaceae bacterium]